MGWFHPATWIGFAIVFGVILLLPLGLVVFEELPKSGAEFRPAESIAILESRVHYGVERDTPYVSCIGTLSNTTDTVWEDLHFEVRFLDGNGELIDTLSDSDYSLVVQPHSEATFRVRGRADKPANKH